MGNSRGALLLVLGLLAGPVAAIDNRFCGGPVAQSGEPTDLAHVVGDQTLEYLAEQPAGLMVCSKGYLLEKCGDHATAYRIFDRCIAAGYIGAMIWKALMLQDGAGGVAPDLPAAAALMARAAHSGDSPYATLGKLHYASALHEGKGVPQDQAEARRWFEAAARDGNPDAQEFLRTGYHTGDRDGQTRGVGHPPATPPPLPGVLMEAPAALPSPFRPELPTLPALPERPAPLARRLSQEPAPVPPPQRLPPAGSAVAPAPPAGQHLARVAPPAPQRPLPLPVAPLLAAVFLSGALCQALRGRAGRLDPYGDPQA